MGFFRTQYLEMYEKEFQKYDGENKQIIVKQLDDREAVEVYIEIALKHGYALMQQSSSMSVFAPRPITMLTFKKA
jgi:hypothetical protein